MQAVGAGRRPVATAIAAAFAALATLLVAPSATWAFGELTQKPGAQGCITPNGTDGAGGACGKAAPLNIPTGPLVSGDGKNAYAASSNNHAVLVFDRDPAGALEQKMGQAGCISATGDNGACAKGFSLISPVALAESPDGRNVYAVTLNSSSIDVFERDQTTGTLTEIGCLSQTGSENACPLSRGLTNARDVAVSPDGKFVYVTASGSNAVAIFERQAGGLLRQLDGEAGCISQSGGDGCKPGRVLNGASGLRIAPDGQHVYVTAFRSEAVSVFSRGLDGTLTQQPGVGGCASAGGGECRQAAGLSAASAIALSPDGRNAYVTSAGSDALALFGIDPASGSLTQMPGEGGCISGAPNAMPCAPATALEQPTGVVISPDGESAYVSAGDSAALAVFDRDPADGRLKQKRDAAGCISTKEKACAAGRLLDGGGDLAISPDGKNLYATVGFSDAIDVFDRSLVRPPSDTTAPVVSGFKLVPARFAPTPRGRGSAFRFRLSEPAALKIVVERARPRRKFRAVLTLRKPAMRAGAARVRFTGRAKKRALRPGRYRATIVATDQAGNASKPRRARFLVVAPRSRRP